MTFMKLTIYSKNQTELYSTDEFQYSGTFMGDRSVSLKVSSPVMIDFLPYDWVEYRNEKFILETTPTANKTGSELSRGDAFVYDLKFVSFRSELSKCMFNDIVPSDNLLHYTGMPNVAFTGDVKQLVDRIRANVDKMYPNAWTFIINSDSKKVCNISLSDQYCVDALALIQSEYGLNFTISGRVVTIGTVGVAHPYVFEYGKGKGLYSIDRVVATDSPVITRLRAYGSAENIPKGYKKGIGSILPVAQYIPSLMLPNYEITGIDYIETTGDKLAIYGVREGIFRDDSIKPSIKEMTGEQIRAAGGSSISNGRVDAIISSTPITTEDQETFNILIPDVGFNIKDYLGDDKPSVEFTDGRLGGVKCEMLNAQFIKDGVTSVATILTGAPSVSVSAPANALKLESDTFIGYLNTNGITGISSQMTTSAPRGTTYKLDFQMLVASSLGSLISATNTGNYVSKVTSTVFVEVVDSNGVTLGSQTVAHNGLDKLSWLTEFQTIANVSIDFTTKESSSISVRITTNQISSRDDRTNAYKNAISVSARTGTDIKLTAGVPAPPVTGGTTGYLLTLARNTDSVFPLPDQLTNASAGDHFILSGIFMPDLYTKTAEQRLLTAASIYLADVDNSKSTYGIGVDEIFMANNAMRDTLYEGDVMHIKDGDVGVDNAIIVQQLNIKHGGIIPVYEVTLSDKPIATTFSRVQSEVANIEQNVTVVKTSGDKVARRNSMSLDRLKDLTFDPEDGKFRTSNIKAGSIDALYLSTGVKSSDFVLNADVKSNYLGNPNSVFLGVGTLVHRELSHGIADVDANFVWNMPQSIITLADPSKVYYVYAKCTTSSSVASWHVTTDMLRFDNNTDQGYYYFRIGDIDSVVNGVRGDALDYGRTWISGRFIHTGVIMGAAGMAGSYFDLDAGHISLGGGSKGLKNLEEWAAEEVKINASANYINAVLPTTLASLQSQIDGEVSSWFYKYSPSLALEPSVSWDTDIVKDRHIGDTFTNTQEYIDDIITPSAGKSWRWMKNGAVYSWEPISDSDSVKALKLAGQAKDVADGKRRTFTSQPTDASEYDAGDMWPNATYGAYSNDILTCITGKIKGAAWNISHWGKAGKYTDDTAVDNLQIGGVNLLPNGNFAFGGHGWVASSDRILFNVNTDVGGYLNTATLNNVNDWHTDNLSRSLSVLLTDVNTTSLTFSFMYYQYAVDKKVMIDFNGDCNVDIPCFDNSYIKKWKKYVIKLTSVSYIKNLYLSIYGSPVADGHITNLCLTEGNTDAPYSECPRDTQSKIDEAKTIAQSTDYLKESLKPANASDFQQGLISSTLMRVGAVNNAGSWIEKAGINGAGAGSLTPRFYSGGDLTSAIRRVNETINKAPTSGEKASYVATEDGRVFMFAGYIGDFELIDGLMSTDSMKLGKIDGIPKLRIIDTSANRIAVEIGDFALSDPSALVGGGAVDVTPAYVYVSTSAPSSTYWLTPAGVSATKTALSTGVSAQTAYQLIFNLIASNSVGQIRTLLGNMPGDDYSSVDCLFTTTVYDSSNNILASNNVALTGSTSNTNEQYLLDKFVSLGFMTSLSGNVFVEIKIAQSTSRFDSNPDGYFKINSITNVAVKLNTKIQLTSGKGIIEIGRGVQALYGTHKYFRIEDEVDTPLIRAEGEFEFNGCITQDLLVGLYCGGTPGYNLGITRWQAHSAYTSSSEFTVAIQSTGHYKVTHNLQTKGVIANIYEYRPVVTAYPYTTWIDPSTITGDSFVVSVVDTATYQNPNSMFIQLWSMKGWKIS